MADASGKTCTTVRELRLMLEDVADDVKIRDAYDNLVHVSLDEEDGVLLIRESDKTPDELDAESDED